METDLLNMFNRFANYLEKNNSSIRIKIENDNIMFIDRTFDNDYITWFVLVKKLPLETQIEYFFFGKNSESAKNSNIPLMVSIFEYCNHCSIDTYLMSPFGFPRTIEELVMKMDLMGI
jgi:hypothetical protein